MTLENGNPGQTYQVMRSDLPLKPDKRMEALGMTAGAKLSLIHKKRSGTAVILLRGTRFAVGRRITSLIQVREVS